MRHCSQPSFTDAALAPLAPSLHTLNGMATRPLPPAFEMPLTSAGKPDFGPVIEGSIAAWRAAHPDALVANVRGRRDLTDADFEHFAGIRALCMSECSQADITSAAFAYLRGIHTLHMSLCTQPTITDEAFAHLSGIHTLNMSGCDQSTITDAAFSHLSGISRLNVRGTDGRDRYKRFAQAPPRHTVGPWVPYAPKLTTLATGQHLIGAQVLGLGESLPWMWPATVPRPLSLEALPHPSALQILLDTSQLPPSQPLSQPLTQFLSEYFTAACSALARQQAPATRSLASHCCVHFIATCGERVCSEVLAPIFASPPLPLGLLADALDNEGRTAHSVAKPHCRALFARHLPFCARYELLPSHPSEQHSSPTCRVLFARDTSPTRRPSEPAIVALKLLRHKEHFEREVGTRGTFAFSPLHVLPLVRTHTPASDPSLTASLALLGTELGDYVHLLVLPAGDRVCSAVIASENQQADWPEVTRTITHALASSLAHMHDKGVIHGDVKPRNIVRCGIEYLLIDLDATVTVGAPVSEKVSTAFAAPELLAHLHSPAAAGTPFLAHPCLDMWSLGATLYLMLHNAHLFHATSSDSLASAAEDGARLAAWALQEQAATVRGIEDRAARALVHDLLHCDPTLRPSAQQVLQHPYITRQPCASRLGGEAPTFDVFLCYREATEGLVERGGSGLVKLLYDALTARGLRVCVDFVELKDGQSWRERLCAGAAASRVFVPLLSSAALASWGALTPSSFTPDSVDTVLLELRLAVELQHRGYLSHIFPVLVGECSPATPAFPIAAIERELVEQLRSAGLTLPFTPPQPVAAIWRAVVKERQGKCLRPARNSAPQLQDTVQRIWGLCRGEAPKPAVPATDSCCACLMQ